MAIELANEPKAIVEGGFLDEEESLLIENSSEYREEYGERLAEVVRGIRRRATFSRVSGLVMISILTAVGTGTALLFVQTLGGPTVYIGQGSDLRSATIQTNGVDWIPELTKSFIRIGGFIMAAFLINVLVSFSGYSLRVANYLDARADTLLIARGDIEKFARLLPAISEDPLDFTNYPMSPYGAYLDALKGVLSRGSQSPAADLARKRKAKNRRLPEPSPTGEIR